MPANGKGDRALAELAKLFKQRENGVALGVITGTVIADPPDIEIKIFGNIILRKDDLVFGSLVMAEEKRNFEIVAGTKDGAGASEGADELSKITLDTDDGTFSGTTNKAGTGISVASVITCVPSPPSATAVNTVTDPTHDHTLKEWSIANNKFTGKGTIKFKNTLKKNDEVIILPAADGGKWFVLDWARRL